MVKKYVDCNRTRSNSLLQKLRKTKGVAALAVMALILPAYSINQPKVSKAEQDNVIAQTNNPQTQPRQQNIPNQQDRSIQEQRRDNVTTEDITDNLNAYVGQTVTVRGKVVERPGTNAFLITDEKLLGSEEILVVNASSQPLRLPEDGIKVQATGVVRNVPLKQIAQQYNLNLADWYAKYRDKPVIIAQSVAPAPEPQEITDSPSPYYGRRLAVPAEIYNVYNPRAFILGDGLLALVANPNQNYRPAVVNKGEKVVATGVLRPFVIADLERNYGIELEPGLRTQLEREYARKPVFIVDAVYPSAVPDDADAAVAPKEPVATEATPVAPTVPVDNAAVAPKEPVATEATPVAPTEPVDNAAVAPKEPNVAAQATPVAPTKPAVNAPTAPRIYNVTAEELADKFNTYVGRTVTTRGQYINKIGENAFTIADEKLLGAEAILVVNVSGDRLVLPSDDVKVQATGEVRRFSLAEIAKKYNMNFDRATYALYENQPVIIAQSAAPAPEPEEITEEPKQYIGKRVAVPGEVQNVYSPVAFTIGDNLLALVANPKQTAVNKGDKVVATGVIRQFVIADIERDYDLNLAPGVQKQLERDYAKKPVLIIDTVYPSAVEQ